ncbi:hypothetical protein HPB50_028994 [Hyalomma asiaticum]|nr:hypothetical protein HPB50_028994 [Hyalomma asiaticum]
MQPQPSPMDPPALPPSVPVLTPKKTPDLAVLRWLRSNTSTCRHFGQTAPVHGDCRLRRTSVYGKSPANRPGDVPEDTLAEISDREADYSLAHSLNAVTTAADPALASIENRLAPLSDVSMTSYLRIADRHPGSSYTVAPRRLDALRDFRQQTRHGTARPRPCAGTNADLGPLLASALARAPGPEMRRPATDGGKW